MLSREATKALIRSTIKKSILDFADRQIRKRDLDEEKAFQILDLIIPIERKIRSIVGGLETSMGRTLWEPLAAALALENGFEVNYEKLKSPSNTPFTLESALRSVLLERAKPDSRYDGTSGPEEIRNVCQAFIQRPIDSFEKASRGYGIDLWLRKEGINYLFDIKTVQPSIGQLEACLIQITHWYGYFYAKYPTEFAQSRIVFPYDPYNGNFWQNIKRNGRPLQRGVEAWVEDEFWNFCSGHEHTFSMIRESFEDLSATQEIEHDLRNMLG